MMTFLLCVVLFFNYEIQHKSVWIRVLELTEDWARGVIKSMNGTKKKGTTGKIEPSKQFLLEEELTFQKKISGVVFEHDIPKELIINLDRTPLTYVNPMTSDR